MAVKFRHKETGLFWCRAKALLHEEIYNELVPQVEPLSEEGEPIVYPYPLLDNQMVEALLETSEWSNIDE